MQAAAGLAAAHEQGLVHRDVKPANILLEKGVERAVLTDFGLARAGDDVSMTRCGVIAGTPQYMSPEQARGESLDGRSDLFSLGCVLYEMATGTSPFLADTTMATLRRLIDEPPPAMASLNAELPPWFVKIVERLLEKDPTERFASAKEVSDLLEKCLAHLQQPNQAALPAALTRTAGSGVPRPFYRTIRGVFIMLSLLGIGLISAFIAQTSPPDIAGTWSNDDWGKVVLIRAADGDYNGTFSQTVGKKLGKINLRWSRIDRRLNGDWSDGEERFGTISLRLAEDGIHGAVSTDAKSHVNTPALSDFVWTQATKGAAAAADDAGASQRDASAKAAGKTTESTREAGWVYGEAVFAGDKILSRRSAASPAKTSAVDTLTPFIDDNTVGAAHVDLARVSAGKSIDLLAAVVPDIPEPQRREYSEMARSIDELAKKLIGLGAKDLYFTLALTDEGESQGLAILPLPACSDERAVRAALPPPFQDARRVGNALVWRLAQDDATPIQINTAPRRAELTPAIESTRANAAWAVWAPSIRIRRLIERKVPQLPACIGGGPVTIVTRDVSWVSLGADGPPDAALKLVVKARDVDAAKELGAGGAMAFAPFVRPRGFNRRRRSPTR